MNFIKSMISENGKVSHKRFIAVIVTLVICFGSSWIFVKYRDQASGVINSLLIFVAVMSGVATIPQILALVRGTPLPKDERSDPEMGESLPNDPNKPPRPPGSL